MGTIAAPEGPELESTLEKEDYDREVEEAVHRMEVADKALDRKSVV